MKFHKNKFQKEMQLLIKNNMEVAAGRIMAKIKKNNIIMKMAWTVKIIIMKNQKKILNNLENH